MFELSSAPYGTEYNVTMYNVIVAEEVVHFVSKIRKTIILIPHFIARKPDESQEVYSEDSR